MTEEDPVLKALRDAPPDDEPVTEEDRIALEEAWEDVRQGRLTAHKEIPGLRVLGKALVSALTEY